MDLRKATFTNSKLQGIQTISLDDGAVVTFDRRTKDTGIKLADEVLVDFKPMQTVVNLPKAVVLSFDHKKRMRWLTLPQQDLSVRQYGPTDHRRRLLFPDPNYQQTASFPLPQKYENGVFRTELPNGVVILDPVETPDMMILVGDIQLTISMDGSSLIIQTAQQYTLQWRPLDSPLLTAKDASGTTLELYGNGGMWLRDQAGNTVRFTVKKV